MYRKIREQLKRKIASNQGKQHNVQNPKLKNVNEDKSSQQHAKSLAQTNNPRLSLAQLDSTIEGSLYRVSQTDIDFGLNAKIKRITRLIVLLNRRNEPFYPYLPASASVKNPNPNLHFHLSNKCINITGVSGLDMLWYYKDEDRYLVRKDEIYTIAEDKLPGKPVGEVINEVRNRIWIWLSGRLNHG